ncbi:MAG: hypothetical protein ACKVTZ_09650 [Bacteroidia bacterium]
MCKEFDCEEIYLHFDSFPSEEYKATIDISPSILEVLQFFIAQARLFVNEGKERTNISDFFAEVIALYLSILSKFPINSFWDKTKNICEGYDCVYLKAMLKIKKLAFF